MLRRILIALLWPKTATDVKASHQLIRFIFLPLIFLGPNISTDQEDHTEDPSDLLPHGHCNRVSHGHRYGGKMPLWWEIVPFPA